ncbi:PAS domain S-box protein, partial [Ectopseudomonas khazarica]
MAIEKKTIRLLILEDSQNEAERLVSLFRNAGHATRVHRLTSSEDLAEALQHTWDLLICAPSSERLDPSEAIGAIRRQAKDIPVVQLVDGNDSETITEALLFGAQDALPQGEDERLVLVAKRELANLEERRARRAAEVALREAEKRCQLLLESSVDAITYVHDGMHIYANRAYLELFRYEDGDELEGMPMIDLIASADQSAFKDFLKNYQSAEG